MCYVSIVEELQMDICFTIGSQHIIASYIIVRFEYWDVIQHTYDYFLNDDNRFF